MIHRIFILILAIQHSMEVRDNPGLDLTINSIIDGIMNIFPIIVSLILDLINEYRSNVNYTPEQIDVFQKVRTCGE